MRKLLVPGLVALALLAPAPGHALVFLGVRAGYMVPSGDAAEGAPMKDGVKSNVPIQVDAGLGLLPFMTLGLYGSWGPTTVASSLDSGSNLRAGLQLNFSPPVLSSLWGGVFGGYEQQSLKPSSGPELKYSGWEAGLQAGYDFSLTVFKLGPFASFSWGEFQSVSGGGASLGDKASHNQLTFGLRAAFDL